MRFQFVLSFQSELTIKISYSVGRVIGYLSFIGWTKAIETYSNEDRNSKIKQNVEIKKTIRTKKGKLYQLASTMK